MNQECGVAPPGPASAVPVLPPAFRPGSAAGGAYAVSTVKTIISFIVAAVRWEIAVPRVPPGEPSVVTAPLGARASAPRYGRGTAPLLAMVEATSAIWTGVARSSPCPNDVWARRSGYHSPAPL